MISPSRKASGDAHAAEHPRICCSSPPGPPPHATQAGTRTHCSASTCPTQEARAVLRHHPPRDPVRETWRGQGGKAGQRGSTRTPEQGLSRAEIGVGGFVVASDPPTRLRDDDKTQIPRYRKDIQRSLNLDCPRTDACDRPAVTTPTASVSTRGRSYPPSALRHRPNLSFGLVRWCFGGGLPADSARRGALSHHQRIPGNTCGGYRRAPSPNT